MLLGKPDPALRRQLAQVREGEDGLDVPLRDGGVIAGMASGELLGRGIDRDRRQRR